MERLSIRTAFKRFLAQAAFRIGRIGSVGRWHQRRPIDPRLAKLEASMLATSAPTPTIRINIRSVKNPLFSTHYRQATLFRDSKSHAANDRGITFELSLRRNRQGSEKLSSNRMSFQGRLRAVRNPQVGNHPSLQWLLHPSRYSVRAVKN